MGGGGRKTSREHKGIERKGLGSKQSFYTTAQAAQCVTHTWRQIMATIVSQAVARSLGGV